jgi:transcriptional regulator with XRE-family HTH domain
MQKNGEIAYRLLQFGVEAYGPGRGWKKKFADALGLSPQNLMDYFAGRRTPGNALQEKLRGLGCNIEYLMTGINQETIAWRNKQDKEMLAILKSMDITSIYGLRRFLEENERLRKSLGPETYAAVLEVAAVREKRARYKSRRK